MKETTQTMPSVPHQDQKTLSIGIIGAGEVAAKLHLPVLTATPGIEVAFVADTRAESAKAVGEVYGIDWIAVSGDVSCLPQTDVALLAVPVGIRAPYYDLFAQRGTAVLAEKPLTVSYDEARRLCALYPEHKLGCGFQRRAYASVAAARACVREKAFGPIRSVRISEGARTTKTGTDARFYDSWSAASGGILRDLGSHSLDLAFHISGASEARAVSQQFYFDDLIDREVHARMVFRGDGGEFETDLFLTWLGSADNCLEFRFDSCILAIPTRAEKPAQLLDLQGKPLGVTLTSNLRQATTTYQAFYLEWEAFISGVRSGTPSSFCASSCLATVHIAEELYAAGRKKKL
ncbi:MAG: Gfo/Idh/MocA family oxidoreductase [Elusimicrobia bacterium]|nr:Gfo/Idh/MocA family oxidoreductase [Elusimicrobiota bacterium]